MSERKAVIKNAEKMQQDAMEIATQALEKCNIEKEIAACIKKEFDKMYNPTWHCIVGRNFGSYVTHETKHFIYFYLGQVAILLFKGELAAALVQVLEQILRRPSTTSLVSKCDFH
ncbi:dynein light chain LC6, flagellar outer arm-like [Dendropsophus ebraccatus]|uniref:dynein light chain LC6, flagellar outer arm-like n=1 Tax=Dendropsophus ebraccatus TaxID=150705 RepID=UPI0038314FAB